MRIKAMLPFLAVLFSLSAFAGPASEVQLDSMNLRAKDFSFTDSGGKLHHLKEYLGQPLILHFWASWCSSCKKEIPELGRISERWSSSGIKFLPIAVDEAGKKGDVARFLAGIKPSVPLFVVAPSEQASRYWAWGVPITYFVSPDGVIFARAMGSREWTGSQVVQLYQKRKVTEKSNR